jgi:hypothetical protein
MFLSRGIPFKVSPPNQVKRPAPHGAARAFMDGPYCAACRHLPAGRFRFAPKDKPICAGSPYALVLRENGLRLPASGRVRLAGDGRANLRAAARKGGIPRGQVGLSAVSGRNVQLPMITQRHNNRITEPNMSQSDFGMWFVFVWSCFCKVRLAAGTAIREHRHSI